MKKAGENGKIRRTLWHPDIFVSVCSASDMFCLGNDYGISFTLRPTDISADDWEVLANV
jgi:hypothetical protein